MRFVSFLTAIVLVVACVSPLAMGQSAVAPPAGEPPLLAPYPLDAIVDAAGTAYVVDRNLHAIWSWKEGQLDIFFQGSATFRTPLNAPRCLAFDTDGSLLVGDSATRDIYRIKADGQAEPITGGQIGIPMDLAVKPDGTIYVADLELRTLFRIQAGSKQVEKVAENNPRGVFVDAQERVWVVSQDPQQLQIVADSGESEVRVGERIFDFPHQVVVNSAGTAFVTDGYKRAIWKVAAGGKPEVVVEGAPLDNPVGITLVDDRVIVTDPRAGKLFRLNDNNQLEVWFEVRK